MTTTSLPTSRLARFAILTATGVTALSLAACGSSNTSSPSTSPSQSAPSTAAAGPTSTSAPTPGSGEAKVSGLIASVAGNAVQVTQQNGTATVDFSGSTKVTQTGPATLTDVTAGTCVSVRPQEGTQPVTAAGSAGQSRRGR